MNSDKSLCDPIGDRKMHGLPECQKQEKSPTNKGKDFQNYVTRKRPPSPIQWLELKNMSTKQVLGFQIFKALHRIVVLS